MNWEPTDGGLIRCTRHPKAEPWTPGRGHCVGCATDPGEVDEDLQDLDAPATAPDGCLTIVQLEAELTSHAKHIAEAAKELLAGTKGKSKGRISYATAFKGYEASLKFFNSALQLCSTRERREYVARLEKLHRQRTRRRAGGTN